MNLLHRVLRKSVAGHIICLQGYLKGDPVVDEEFALEGVTHIKGVNSDAQLKLRLVTADAGGSLVEHIVNDS